MSIDKHLDAAGFPQELRQAFKDEMKKSRHDFWRKAFYYKATAMFMAGKIAKEMKWEDDQVPERYMKWRNNISPHGDAFNWGWYDDPVSGTRYLKREAAPLDKEVRVNNRDQPLCYWRKGNPHTRETESIKTWLRRNPGSGACQDEGVKVPGATRVNSDGVTVWDYQVWGSEGIDLENSPGRERVGVRVLSLGGHYQIKVVKKLFWRFGISGELGYKLGNVKADYDVFDPNAEASVTYTWLPCFLK